MNLRKQMKIEATLVTLGAALMIALFVYIGAPVFSCIVILVCFAALVRIIGPDRPTEKNVLSAERYGKFPGLGHIYVGRYMRSIPFFVMDALFVASMLLCAVSEDDLLLVSNSIAMLFGLLFISMVDAGRLCEEMYEGGARGRFRLAYFSIIAACYLFIMVAIAGIICTGGMVDPRQYIAVGGMWTMAMTLATHRYLRTRHLDPPKGWMTL